MHNNLQIYEKESGETNENLFSSLAIPNRILILSKYSETRRRDKSEMQFSDFDRAVTYYIIIQNIRKNGAEIYAAINEFGRSYSFFWWIFVGKSEENVVKGFKKIV